MSPTYQYKPSRFGSLWRWMRDLDPIVVLFWTLILCGCALLIAKTVKAIASGEP